MLSRRPRTCSLGAVFCLLPLRLGGMNSFRHAFGVPTFGISSVCFRHRRQQIRCPSRREACIFETTNYEIISIRRMLFSDKGSLLEGAVERSETGGLSVTGQPLRRGVKKTCRWHVFSHDLGGYAAVAATSPYTGETLDDALPQFDPCRHRRHTEALHCAPSGVLSFHP